MKTMSLQAPYDVRRSREKAKKYLEPHEQMYRETEDARVHRECVAALSSVLSTTDFSEVSHGA